jgi:cyclopropane fatty-acyl-phospholipid synthase-like methyltransferase
MNVGLWDGTYRDRSPSTSPEVSGVIRDPVLDVGCGTGENALLLSDRGHDVLGVDIVPRAIEHARAKAKQRGSSASFEVWDALDLPSLGKRFSTIIDSGVFHVFSDADRAAFVTSLAAVLEAGGTYYMLCFSDRQPGKYGPRRITQSEINEAFSPASGWSVEEIREARFDILNPPQGAAAWFATITRTDGP